MEEGRPSETALMVAIMRAYHHHYGLEPKILTDNVALTLSGLGDKANAKNYIEGMIGNLTKLSDPDTATLFVRRIMEAVCMRSRLVDERLASAMERGLKQFVVLGAGLDSTAYRSAQELTGISVFEVDFPATQKWKREQLTKGGIDIPDNVTFVPCDFEKTNLSDAMVEGGIDHKKMTMFSWLGVQPYLTDDAVKSTLNILGGFAKGSELILDFIMPDYDAKAGYDEEGPIEHFRTIVAGMSEPFKSTYSEVELRNRFHSAGFAASKFYTTRDLVDAYFGGNGDHISLREDAIFLASATV